MESTYPSFKTIERMLKHWAASNSDRMRLSEAGRSRGGRPVYCVELTDPQTGPENKEHALITGLHSGVERSGATCVCALIEWLLGDDPAAQETLRRQRIACIPMAHPDGYVEGNHGSVYGGWTLDGPTDPTACPEAVAVQSVMDRLQPDLHADVHGMSMSFEGYEMLENSANSYSNLALRCYHPEIVRAMDEAALAEGYPSDRQESDAERLFWGPELEACSARLWEGRPRIYAAIYAYHLYHTMLSASEISWEHSGVLRHARLLAVGNETWPGELDPGYPNRVVRTNHYHALAAYGSTAVERRRSRVELWQKQEQLGFGMVDPPFRGKILALCTASADALGKHRDPDLRAIVTVLRTRPDTDADYLSAFLADWPAGQNRDVPYIFGANAPAHSDVTIKHGLAIRLRVFSENAQIRDVRLNGHPLKESRTNGYVAWSARGMTFVQINVPPDDSCSQDLFLATCEYTPTCSRNRWQTWREFEE